MFTVGQRVVLTCADPLHNGQRGTVTREAIQNFVLVRFDDDGQVYAVAVEMLEREADSPDYPQPNTETE